MKKKIVAFVLCGVMLALPLAACSGGEVTTATPETTAPETTYDYDRIPEVIEPHEEKVLTADELGFPAVLTKTEKYWVADAAVTDGGDLTVVSYNPGTTVITATNSYSETVDVTVTVGLDYSIESIEYTPFERPENHAVITDYGASPSKADNAPSIQAAIDAVAAKGEGTVYVPRGTYKSNTLELKSKVTLRLEGVLSEYNTEYTVELDRAIRAGEFGVIHANGTDMFVNHKPGGWGREGADDFAVIGGVIDMDAKNRCFIWCCADGVLLENVIMKDCLANHAIQITGSRNVTIRNCMFAGFNGSGGYDGEAIQIETSHPGAINSSSSKKQSYFDDYEYYSCANVTFENVYFGRSVEYDAHNIPIGHHGHPTEDVLDGLRIIGCTFDNPRRSAIRAYAYANVEIADCRFISDRANQVGGAGLSMIQLTLNTGNVGYSGGYLTLEADRGGCRNMSIHDNEFIIGEKSQMGSLVETLKSGKTSVDAVAYSGKIVYEHYKAAPKVFSGYKLMTNRMENISIHNNSISVHAATCKALFKLNQVEGLDIRDNEIDTSIRLSTGILGGERIEGGLFGGCTSADEHARSFTVSCLSVMRSSAIVFGGGEVESEVYCNALGSAEVKLTLHASEGGRIGRSTDEGGGALYIEPIADEGYRFDGYYIGETRIDSARFGFASATTVELRFSAIE